MLNITIENLFTELQERYSRDLTFQEIRRGLQALSQVYTAKRNKLQTQGVWDGAGKRAAFALYYGSIHFVLFSEIARSLGPNLQHIKAVLDLGCGTGVGALAWAAHVPQSIQVTAVDEANWAVGEARWLMERWGVAAKVTRQDVLTPRFLGREGLVFAGFTVNELADAQRQTLCDKLMQAHADGAQVLIVEPIANNVVPWWSHWQKIFADRGGQTREWKIPTRGLPEGLLLLDKAAAFHHRVLSGRSLYLPPK